MNERQPWVWMRAGGGWKADSDPRGEYLFHAYDVNEHAACEPSLQLGVSDGEPTPTSHYCIICKGIVKAHPLGRFWIDYAAMTQANHNEPRFKQRYVPPVKVDIEAVGSEFAKACHDASQAMGQFELAWVTGG